MESAPDLHVNICMRQNTDVYRQFLCNSAALCDGVANPLLFIEVRAKREPLLFHCSVGYGLSAIRVFVLRLVLFFVRFG